MVLIEEVNKLGKNSITMETYEFTNKRNIYISGEITDELAAEIIRQLNYLNEVQQNDITVWINSPGGSVTAGLAIYDAMKMSKCDVATHCYGIAASMAAVLLAGGKKGKRSGYLHSEVMIHQIMGGMQGQATDLGISYKRIEKRKHLLNEIMANNTGQEYEKIAADTERDYFMTAEEAYEYGILDYIKK